MKAIKRIFDILASLLAIVILSPFLLIFSIILKLDSKGPILFKQKRLGKNGKIFTIYKFRTMVVNAENIGDGISIKSDKDPRITKVGGVYRKTSIDELPQLFNVLLGDMSLVGPRPPVIYTPYDGYENYPEWAKKRFEMRPGVTGLAQVKVRNSATWDERIKIDNEYIDRFSLWLDIKILFMTVGKVFGSDNIYN
nr:sugar transferase [Helcococcus sueciensis]